MLKMSVRRELEPYEYEVELNLENNYKDLARQAFLDYAAQIKRLHDAGEISDKDFAKLEKKCSDLAVKFETYHY